MTFVKNAARGGMAILLAALLIASGVLAAVPFPRAWADEVEDGQRAIDEAQASLDDAEARMGAIVSDYEALSAEVAMLQDQIDAAAAEVLVAQQAMLEGKAALGDAASYQYRSDPTAAFLSVLLESSSLSDLFRNMKYIDQIMEHQAQEVSAQRERKERFEQVSADLTQKRDEQERVLGELEAKREEATQLVATAGANLSGAQADQAARLEALRAQAEQFNQSTETGGADISEDANTVDREEVVPDDAPVIPNPDNGSSEGDGSGGSSGNGSDGSSGNGADSSLGWFTGVASAYGGSSDPYTPNPGITATGAVCDDWSMGVAVPMSLPNYRSYFGRTVEISYGGMTVYAVVNDCGYMGGGSRALDLQPGVFKAFGFGDCYAWGLRTVNYRFL